MAKKKSDEPAEPLSATSLLPPIAPATTAPATAAYVVLARKYRPQSFDDLIGQEAMVTTLRNAFSSDRIAQGYMLTGVRGVGKTTTARILARALNYDGPATAGKPTVDMPALGIHCASIIESRHPDVIEMDAASNTGIEDVREIIENARYKPMVARTKVFIIDEVHMLSKSAFNALLKTLEEPPPHVKFIFATTEIRKVPVTVLSRCQRFDLRRVDVPVLAAHFERIVGKEGVTAEDSALALIARAAEGSVRDGLSVLDQAIASAMAGEGGARLVTEEAVRGMLGLADRGRLFDLLEHLFAGRAGDALASLAALHRDGADPAETLADLAEAVHTTTRLKVAGSDAGSDGLSAEEKRRATTLSGQISLAVLSRAWQMLLKGLEDVARAPNAEAAAEMVLIRIAHAADLPTPEDIIRTLGGGTMRRPAAGAGSTPAREAPPRADRRPLNEAPPPASLEDYGAFDAAESLVPIEPDEDSEDADEAPLSPAARLVADPKSFQEVVDLAGIKRDARLKLHLEEDISLVKFDGAAGAIEIFLLKSAPATLANHLRERLNLWTGRRWMVAVGRLAGERPVGEVRREREAAELEVLKAHPALRSVLETFPEAEITSVTPVRARRDDDQAAG